MTSSRKEALYFLDECGAGNSGSNPPCQEVHKIIKVLEEFALNEGLSECRMETIIQLLTSNKLGSSVQVDLLKCMIPETIISKSSLIEVFVWFFNGIACQTISLNVQKKFMQWLLAITYYELLDVSAIDLFYCSFMFLMKQSHLEALVCSLLCLISKSEHARRWTVQQVLKLQSVSGPKAHSNAFLNLIKSFRADVVPERIPVSIFHPKSSWFMVNLKKAHTRKLKNSSRILSSYDTEGLQFNTWKIFNKENFHFGKLIPTPVMENELRFNSCPPSAQILSSVSLDNSFSNRGFDSTAYHLLAFTDADTKIRFSHKLYQVLWRVFLLDLEPYSEREKIVFLNSLGKFLEYIHQSIPVVTDFIFNYLLIWDGETYQKQILKFVEWVQVKDEKDLEKYVFFPLRQIYISSGTDCKCLIIKTMGNLLRNLIVMDKKESYFFANEYLEMNAAKAVEAVGRFVNGLVSNGLIWNDEETTRNILMSSIDFYEVAQAVEQAGDLPLIILMPPILVYKCLFSDSVFLIARLCSILLKFYTVSVERLYALGVSEDFSTEVQILKIYLLDVYRCLWNTVGFSKENNSFLFNEEIFLSKFSKLKDAYGPYVSKIFCVEHSPVFWNESPEGLSEGKLLLLAQEFPSILELKHITEQQLIQVSSFKTIFKQNIIFNITTIIS